MKTTFALQDQNNITDRLMEVGITLFSNIVNLPILFLAIYVYGRVSSFYQAKRTKFYFQPTNKLYQELLKNSKLTQMRYRPWTYAFNGHWQAFLFPAIEISHQWLTKLDFIGEVLTLSDGGTILLDWYVNPDVATPPHEGALSDAQEPQYVRTKPLVVIVPGLTGCSSNLYCTSSIKEAQRHGYDAVVVNYRCQAGLKPTSPHIYHAGNC